MDYEKMYKEAVIKMRLFFKKYNGLVISEDGTMYKDLLEIFPDIARLENGQLMEFLADFAKEKPTTSVWHKVTEEPKAGKWILLQHSEGWYHVGRMSKGKFDKLWVSDGTAAFLLSVFSKWAYIDDLLKL